MKPIYIRDVFCDADVAISSEFSATKSPIEVDQSKYATICESEI